MTNIWLIRVRFVSTAALQPALQERSVLRGSVCGVPVSFGRTHGGIAAKILGTVSGAFWVVSRPIFA